MSASASNTLLTIFNVAAEDDICRTMLPYWERSGATLLFSSPYDARSQLDYVLHYHAGRAVTREKASWWYYQSRVLETMKAVMELPFKRFIFTQYDSLCLDRLPADLPPCTMHVSPNGDDRFKARTYVHPPWCFNREVLEKFVVEADRHPIASEYGVMDRWMAWLLEQAGIAVVPSNPWSWSANSIDKPYLVADCRTAIARGATFIHGCKNLDQLGQILKP